MTNRRLNGSALKAALEEVKRDSKNPDAWLRLGSAYQALRQFDDSIKAFRQAVELRPDYPAAIAALAVALTNAGRSGEALPLAREAVKQSPDDARMHAVLAFALVEQGLTQEALSEADRALELGPAEAFVQVVRSEALRSLGRVDEAFEAAKAAADQHGDDPSVLRLLARAALNAKQFGAAEDAARRLLALDVAADQGYLLLGLALSQQNAFRDAENAFRKGLEFKPDEPELLNGLGYVLALQSRYQEAEPLVRKAASLKQSWYILGTLAVVLIGLADAYKDKELFAEARDVLNNAVQLTLSDTADQDEEAKLYLQRGYANARIGNVEAAKHDFRTATSKARPMSGVGLAAGRNLRRLNTSPWLTPSPPGWLPHGVAVCATVLLVFSSVLIAIGKLDSGAYAAIAGATFIVVFAGYSLPSVTRLKLGVVELERVAGPLALPHLEIVL